MSSFIGFNRKVYDILLYFIQFFRDIRSMFTPLPLLVMREGQMLMFGSSFLRLEVSLEVNLNMMKPWD